MAPTRTFSDELRKVALTLNLYSAKAYAYLRSKVGDLLPAPSTLRRYYTCVDGKPGFTEEAFTAIKARSKTQPVICNLVLDEMSIREQLHYCSSSGKLYGIVDLGTRIEEIFQKDDSELPKANKALVIMAVSLKER